jgi:hypothetical protein
MQKQCLEQSSRRFTSNTLPTANAKRLQAQANAQALNSEVLMLKALGAGATQSLPPNQVLAQRP